ncbi:MAG: NFACT RNA binding domain-containing protein [Cyclobacteriaceae bacterium]|nr:NFACT RNA binding domain-containing protein [Cyclobacteriaceae bacterium]
MHNNFYFLRQLSKALDKKLNGFTLVSCFSQNKEELILEFNNSTESFFVKASLQPAFCCLSFPSSFHRAKKNSIDLFPVAILKKVKSIRQFENERSILIELEQEVSLLFKMHGSQSNVIQFKNQKAQGIFRNQFQNDFGISLAGLDKSVNWSKELFIKHLHELQKNYFTFGKSVIHYLEEKLKALPTDDDKWSFFQRTKNALEVPHYYLTKKYNKLSLSLIPMDEVVSEFDNPISAINDFYYRYTISTSFEIEKAKTLKTLSDQLKGSNSFIAKNIQKVNELTNDTHYQLWGDLVMANMHEIKTGAETIDLINFYTHQPEKIKLKRELNPQRNAEVFYRKAKNQQIEIGKLNETILSKKLTNEKIKQSIENLEKAEDMKTVRQFGKEESSLNKKTKPKPLPYHTFEYKGFQIWVGKNAEANDRLTLKHSYKEDLWLHAKDVAGSHVIIKHQSGKNFPKDVIERAAELAAYNSKRKTDSLCPVAYTPKKYVRKRKGDPAGTVIVEKEDVVMVVPKL